MTGRWVIYANDTGDQLRVARIEKGQVAERPSLPVEVGARWYDYEGRCYAKYLDPVCECCWWQAIHVVSVRDINAWLDEHYPRTFWGDW